jgi:hypothetical protein
MSHYCWKKPGDRAAIFSATNNRVQENVAWSSNIRDCKWAIFAWITDDNQLHRGHRKNIFGENQMMAMTGLSSDGYYYTQQNGNDIRPKASYNKDYRDFGIYKKYDGKTTSQFSFPSD